LFCPYPLPFSHLSKTDPPSIPSLFSFKTDPML
jgi:hypothetical protein